MERSDQLQVFKAQTQNVRELEKAWGHLLRSINRELVRDNLVSAALHTKLLALVFCAWSEANFSKLIHTPYGFTTDEIEQIKSHGKSNITRGWEKCLELGLRRIESSPRSNYLPNIRQAVGRIITKYVQEPSLLRNKIAHGQWVIALNRDNDALNNDLTHQVNNTDCVKLDMWREVYKGLSNIVEALIESPNRSFHRDYWIELGKLDQLIIDRQRWSLGEKINQLKEKHSHRRQLV
jgi:hypothetical protein